MAHLKLPTRLLVLTLALCLLCPPSVAGGPSFGVARRTLLQGEGDDWAPSPDDVTDPADTYSDPPVGAGDATQDVDTPGPASDNPNDVPDEDDEDGPEPNGGDDESGDNYPVDDPAAAVDETTPEFEDTPPEYTDSPPTDNPAESTTTDQTSPNADATDSAKKGNGPSSAAVAFSVIGALAFVAVVAGAVFFIIRQRDSRGLEFKPLREMELSNDAGEKGEFRDSNPETYSGTKLQRSDSDAYN